MPTRRITALHVAGRGRKARLIDWSAISGFGPDGIIVHGEDPRRPPADDRELAVASGKLDLDGRLVLSENGDSVGSLADVLFDEGSGELTGLVAGEREIGAERIRAVGPYCVIVAAD